MCCLILTTIIFDSWQIWHYLQGRSSPRGSVAASVSRFRGQESEPLRCCGEMGYINLWKPGKNHGKTIGKCGKLMETTSFEGSKPGSWGVPDLRHSQNMAKSTISRGFRRWTWWCSCSSLAQWVLDWSHILWSWFVTLPSDSHWMSLKYSTGTPLLIWLVAWVSTWRNEVCNFHMDLTPNHDMKQHGCVFKMKSSSKAIVVNVIFQTIPACLRWWFSRRGSKALTCCFKVALDAADEHNDAWSGARALCSLQLLILMIFKLEKIAKKWKIKKQMFRIEKSRKQNNREKNGESKREKIGEKNSYLSICIFVCFFDLLVLLLLCIVFAFFQAKKKKNAKNMQMDRTSHFFRFFLLFVVPFVSLFFPFIFLLCFFGLCWFAFCFFLFLCVLFFQVCWFLE